MSNDAGLKRTFVLENIGIFIPCCFCNEDGTNTMFAGFASDSEVEVVTT